MSYLWLAATDKEKDLIISITTDLKPSLQCSSAGRLLVRYTQPKSLASPAHQHSCSSSSSNMVHCDHTPLTTVCPKIKVSISITPSNEWPKLIFTAGTKLDTY